VHANLARDRCTLLPKLFDSQAFMLAETILKVPNSNWYVSEMRCQTLAVGGDQGGDCNGGSRPSVRMKFLQH
jgi:hypothetical protein